MLNKWSIFRPEVNIGPWDEEFSNIKEGSQARSWKRKWPVAYWKGNPDVGAPIREELLKCNHSRLWRAQILRQDWLTEVKEGFEKSKLSKQCDYRLKYILACGSLPLIISPEYDDFFSRGLFPKKNYWPIPATNLCNSIKYAVEWGNAHLDELTRIRVSDLIDDIKEDNDGNTISITIVGIISASALPLSVVEAGAIGRGSQDFMGSINMARVYDYMLHLITEYSKLLKFKPVQPSSAQEVCAESLLCYADQTQTKFLERSTSAPSSSPPCMFQPPDSHFFKSWLQEKNNIIKDMQNFVST
ncbi:hypothetical protein U1Q18_033487 [Sarracenia purpurea var. burkii]